MGERMHYTITIEGISDPMDDGEIVDRQTLLDWVKNEYSTNELFINDAQKTTITLHYKGISATSIEKKN